MFYYYTKYQNLTPGFTSVTLSSDIHMAATFILVWLEIKK
jgi:hypothetical protein